MRSARNRRKKTKFIKKLKAFIFYSFVSIIVLGFFLNTYVSNILEYSFALADSGGLVDIKTDQKYSIALISTNKLKEVKTLNLLTYDKTGERISNFILDTSLELVSGDEVYPISELLRRNNYDDTGLITKILSESFGTPVAFTYISSSDDFDVLNSILNGNSTILELYKARELAGVDIRDLYLIYSFSGKVDSNSKKEVTINSYNILDKELKDIYIDTVLGIDANAITVVNTTNINGLGKKFSRKITNLGGRVIDTSNGSFQEKESFIIYKNRSESVNFLESKLGIKKSYSQQEIGLKYPEIIKSDIVVVLGIDKIE